MKKEDFPWDVLAAAITGVILIVFWSLILRVTISRETNLGITTLILVFVLTIKWLRLHLTINLVIWISISILMIIGSCLKLTIICRQIIRARKMAIINNKKNFFHKR